MLLLTRAADVHEQDEIKAVVKRRTHFEYALRRRISRKADFLRYAEYEINLEALRRRRKERLGMTRLPLSWVAAPHPPPCGSHPSSLIPRALFPTQARASRAPP